RVAVLVACGDVEEGEFVRAGGIVGDRGLHRIAGVAQVDEVDAFDDAAVLYVQAGDDADFEHQRFACWMSLSASVASSRPSYKARPAMAPSSFAARGSSKARISSIEARPPDAITGIEIASASAMVASRLRPFNKPSREMSV